MGVYVAERQVEYWTSVKIHESLQGIGAQVLVYPLTQRLEKVLGVDFVFACDLVKLFGLQYKVLYDDNGDHWNLTPPHQYATLQKQDWTYYCCSDVKTMREAPAALHLARFYDPRAIPAPPYSLAFNVTGYSRWGGFLGQLRDCWRGAVVADHDGFRARLGTDPEAIEILDMIALMGWTPDSSGSLVPTAACIFDGTLRDSGTILDQ